MNHEITASSVRLLDSDSQQIGIVSIQEALTVAQERGLDLAEVSPNTEPPVVKLIDWGKYRYEQEKQLQKSRRNQKNVEVKQVRLGLKTGSHDIDVKLKAAVKFLEQGNKVKVNLRFKGREITHPELGRAILDDFYSKVHDIATKEQEPNLSGRELSMVLARRKDAKAKDE